MNNVTHAFRAIIVDDETGCIDNMLYHISTYCPEIQVVGTASSIVAAKELFLNQHFDIAFLDVELFDENIFQLLYEQEQFSFNIIFVTAHERYAVEAFRVSALDYLVKPLDKYELLRCYQKIQKLHQSKEVEASEPTIAKPATDAKIVIRKGNEVFVITRSDILSLEANGFYTKVRFAVNGGFQSAVVSKTIKALHEAYDFADLIRVHRSFAININHVLHVQKKATGITINMQDGIVIPIAKRRTTFFLQHYKSL